MTAQQVKSKFWTIKEAWGININTLMLAMLFWLLRDKYNTMSATLSQVPVNTIQIEKNVQAISDIKQEADETRSQVGNIYLSLPDFQLKQK